MSILDIAKQPELKKSKCIACKWVETLDELERKHLDILLLNYTTAELCRQLRQSGVVVGESTLRKHISAGH